MALTLDRRKLQKKVQRMNEAAEEDRLRHASALQRRIRDVEVEIQSLTETIYRLVAGLQVTGFRVSLIPPLC